MRVQKNVFGCVRMSAVKGLFRNPFKVTRCAGTQSLITIRPYRHAKSLASAGDFLRTMHKGKSVHSFEIWFENGKAKVLMCSSEPELELRKKIASFYPSADILKPEKEFVSGGEEFYIIRATLQRGHYLPLRTDMNEDPLNTLLTAMIGLEAAVYQVVFTPAPKRWMKGAAKVAEGLLKGRVTGWLDPKIVPAGPTEKELAKQVLARAAQPTFAAEIRVAVFGEAADEVVGNFESFFNLFTNPAAEQGFKVEEPMNQTAELERMKQRCISLPVLGGKKNVFTAEELALLAHIPGEEVHVRDLEWTFARKDLKPPHFNI